MSIALNIEFTSVNDSLPMTKAGGNPAFVYMKTADGSIKKGMFYINGKTPVFASYGSQVDGVIAWAYY